MPIASRISIRTVVCLAIVLPLAQCVMPVSADRKSSIRKVAIVNYVEPAFKRYKVGFTVFGNVMDDKLVLEELRPRMQAILEEESRKRFPSVVAVRNPPELPRGNPLTGRMTEINQLAARIGAQSGADTVLIIVPYAYYPYGVPNYMTSEGLGLWHIGKDSAFVMCYARTGLYDGASGKSLGFPHAYTNKITEGIPWKDRFTDHPPAERELILNRLLEAYRSNIVTSLKSLGFQG
jgi:hypothetical protein